MSRTGYNSTVNGFRVRQFGFNTWSRAARRVSAVCLLASCFVFAASARTYQLPANAAESPGWVLTDLDGDRIADLATASLGVRDGRDYVHQIDIELTGFPASSFLMRGSSSSIRLSFRDIDGDDDRDLIVFEPGSVLPLGLWLNDGAGHFTQANVKDYLGALGKPDTRSFDSGRAPTDASAGLQDQRTPSKLSSRATGFRAGPSGNVASGARRYPACIVICGSSPRGPPRDF
jgi:hypothetical protein